MANALDRTPAFDAGRLCQRQRPRRTVESLWRSGEACGRNCHLDPSGHCNEIRYEDTGGSIQLHPDGLTPVVFLDPGTYSISCFLYTDVGSSLAYIPVFEWLNVQFEAGHSYKVEWDQDLGGFFCSGDCNTTTITILEVNTGEVVASHTERW